MNEVTLKAALQDLPLGGLRFFEHIGSTNDLALAWASEGADDLSLVVADEQTAGRGRAGRRWYTPPGSALAFSLILHPNRREQDALSRFTGLGALALVTAIQNKYHPHAQIKWPNDVLIEGRKMAGILVESTWTGEQIERAVLGIGVNVRSAAVPPPGQLAFPATSLEDTLGRPVDRVSLLHDILAALIVWRTRLGTEDFIRAWDEKLSFRGEQVQVQAGNAAPLNGELLGLGADGSLQLRTPDGETVNVHFGDIHLRPTGV
ncbi:MAG: biotin--[acetyl-CoA-carboxylase] ligase [Chloroflexi bacterium]|nr:biotin--[acetyl-CoA-carboxylase] ligase [Chloroflexota bacterium]